MSHDHSHRRPHSHSRDHDIDEATRASADTSVSDSDLTPGSFSRRRMLKAAGVTGALTAGMSGMLGVTPAMAEGASRSKDDEDSGRGHGEGVRHWLAGDHHIHTQHSSDAMYTVHDQAQHGAAFGLDWMVITDHGGVTHARIGVHLVNPDIRAARAELEDALIFQGLEWNIPAAEHGTVFVVPGKHEVEVLKQFENDYDGSVRGASGNTPENEALAVAGIQWLGKQEDRSRVEDALFLANHPARNGIDSPHEIRAWRDADPRIAVGWEGAPGHQAVGLPKRYGPGSARGSTTVSCHSTGAVPFAHAEPRLDRPDSA